MKAQQNNWLNFWKEYIYIYIYFFFFGWEDKE